MAINLAELTNGTTVTKKVDGINTHTWQGTAIFDVLVRMVNENLKIQYDEGRIKATDYAEAYIAGLQTCITEAMKYIMQKDSLDADVQVKLAQKDIADEEAKLKAAQILTEQEEARLKAAQANAIPLQTAKEIDLKQAQINTANEDKRLKAAQADSYPAQAAADLAVKTAQVELYNKQKAGFDDNRRQKLFEATVNSWALAYSSGILDTAALPAFINNTDMADLFTTIRDT